MARRLFIAAIVATCLGGSVVEVFDRWDETLNAGNDTEANVVVTALTVGVAFAIGTVIVANRIRAVAATPAGAVITPPVVVYVSASRVCPVPTSSPPTILRI